jgi:zinc protease
LREPLYAQRLLLSFILFFSVAALALPNLSNSKHLFTMLYTTPASPSFRDRSRPPHPTRSVQANFPVWHETTLSNGLKIMVYEQHRSPLVSVRLYSRAGSFYDGAYPTVSMFVFALLMQGTHLRTAEQIAHEVEFLGADLSAFSGIDSATLSLSIMSKHLDRGLALMCDVALHPAFADREIEFVRQQVLNRLQFSKSNAGHLATEAFAKAIYQTHPYSQPAFGTEHTVRAISREAIVEFYETYMVPNNSFIVVAGDVKPQEIIEKLSDAFGAWSTKPIPSSVTFASPSLPHLPQAILVQKDGAVQSVITMGHLSIARSHPDYLKCYVMNMILGGYFGSRLNLKLREKQGYTYNIRSTFDAKAQLGDFHITTQVRKGVTKLAIQDILDELHELLLHGVRDEELQAVKNYISGNFIIQSESPDTILNRLATMELYQLGSNYYNTFLEQVQHLTINDVHNAAKMYIHPDRLTYVVAGEAKAVRADLEEFGELVVIDAEGNPLPAS